MTARQVAAARRGGPALPPDAVALTFDDGFLDVIETVVPAPAACSLPAALSVTTGALRPHRRSVLPEAPMLSMDEVAELDGSGIEICSHAHVHEQLDTNAFSPADDDPYRIARLMVRQATPPETFAAWLAGAGAPTATAREHPKTTLWRHYRRGRARLHAERKEDSWPSTAG